MRRVASIAGLAVWLFLAGADPAWTQSTSGQPRQAPSRFNARPATSTTTTTTTPATGRANPSDSTRTRERPAAPARGATPDTAANPETSSDDTDADAAKPASKGGDVGLIAGMRAFVRENALWIFGGLGAGLAGALAWMFIAGKKKSSGAEDVLERLDDDDRKARRRSRSADRFSSTRIRARDVQDRLGSTVGGTEIETDREYALVVEEGALHAEAPKLDAHTGRTYTPDREIREAIGKRDFAGAWQRYCELVDDDGSREFQDDVEFSLSEHFLREKEFGKAARILEHHVATHARQDIKPEVYFNLGYIHILRKTYNKSRRFLRLYMEVERSPKHRARAQGILDTLEVGS
jgi:hypothetical protein